MNAGTPQLYAAIELLSTVRLRQRQQLRRSKTRNNFTESKLMAVAHEPVAAERCIANVRCAAYPQ
jgi:hypothetical protein